MSSVGSLLSVSLKEAKDAKAEAKAEVKAAVSPEKVIVLHHHFLSEEERKALFQGVSVVKFDPAIHSRETAESIMQQVRVLLVDISFAECDLWYRKQANWVKSTNCSIVYLARKGIHCSLEEDLKNKYQIDHVKKRLDSGINDLESLIADLLIPHVPGLSRDCLTTVFSCAKTAAEYVSKK